MKRFDQLFLSLC